MTELEQQLLTAFEKLSKQYELDALRLAGQNLRLQKQVEQLSEQVQSLAGQVLVLNAKLTELAES